MLLTVEGAATKLEGPLLFLRRTLDVGLYDAVDVRGADGHSRLGRIAAQLQYQFNRADTQGLVSNQHFLRLSVSRPFELF